ncbi:MAG: sigma-54 dependent transcriptional regulator [Myxococcota bacterium]
MGLIMLHVLIADDDKTNLYLLKVFCQDLDNVELSFASDGQEALEHVRGGDIDILITDLRMPVLSGDELLDAVKSQFPHIPVIIMTGFGSIEGAVDYVHRGADDYLTKPLTKDVFNYRLRKVVNQVALTKELQRLKERETNASAQLLGASEAMVGLKNQLPTLAQTEASIVVYGESGTGKEVVARIIHQLSRRRDKPFVTVNCGALPENLLEAELFGYRQGAFTDARADNPGLVDAADTGTLFLDEIGEISLNVQVKLLRFLELKEYKPVGSPKSRIADVRIIAATNRNLKRAVEERSFREDLYYRLNVVPVRLPPLRERGSDVSLLARSFLQRFNDQFNKSVRLSPESYRKLESYHWPGNIRELENKIEQIVVMARNGELRTDEIDVGDSTQNLVAVNETEPPPPRRNVGAFQEEKQALLRRFEREYLVALLEEEGGHITNAAKRAGLDRKNLWQLMKRHNMKAEVFKKRA